MKKSKASVDRTLTEIIATALEIFSKKGYVATNLQDIAKALGITRTPLYYHFKNKTQLYEKAVEYFLKKREDTIKEIYFSDLDIFAKNRLHLLHNCEYGLIEASLFMGVDEVEELVRIKRLRQKTAKFIFDAKIKFVKEAIDKGELKADTDPKDFVRHTYVLYYGMLSMVSRGHFLHKMSTEDRVRLIDQIVEAMALKYSALPLPYDLTEPVTKRAASF